MRRNISWHFMVCCTQREIFLLNQNRFTLSIFYNKYNFTKVVICIYCKSVLIKQISYPPILRNKRYNYMAGSCSTNIPVRYFLTNASTIIDIILPNGDIGVCNDNSGFNKDSMHVVTRLIFGYQLKLTRPTLGQLYLQPLLLANQSYSPANN